MPTSIRPARRSRAGLPAFASMFVLASLVVSITAADVATQPRSAKAAGETWHGTLEWHGRGLVPIAGGIKYTNNDSFKLSAGRTSETAVVTAKIDTKIVYPPPELGGCYVRLETVRSPRVNVVGSFSVSDQGPAYSISASADNVSFTHDVMHGGGTLDDGTVCSDMDSSEYTSFGPLLEVRSFQNAHPKYRAGTISVGSDGLGSSCTGKPECASMQSFRYWPKLKAQWSIARNECTGFSKSYNLGGQDTVFVFPPCQTKNLSTRISLFDQISGTPKVCHYAYVKRLSQACKAHEAVTRTQWAQNDWFMYTAANAGDCGVWVIDRASWRPPKIKPATRAADGQAVSSIGVGGSVRVRTSTGSVTVTCP